MTRALKATIGRLGVAAAAACLGWLALSPSTANAAAVGACSYTGWGADGCATATGGFLIAPYYGAPDFYTYAAQSGQKWAKGPHPWNWNSPGIDYGVGPPPGRVLLDPATAPLPAGCVYKPTGSPAHGGLVSCGKGAVSPTFDGYDFSLHDCIVFQSDANATGLITITNSKFVNGPGCSVQFGYMIKIVNGNSGLLLVNDLIDEAYPKYTTPLVASVVANTATASLTVLNSAILNTSSRPLSGTSNGPLDIENSVFAGFVLASTANTGQHGELFLHGCPVYQAVYPSIVYRNNVILVPASCNVTVTTAFYPNGLNQQQNEIQSFVADHNVVVTNYAGGVNAKVATNISGSVSNNVMTVNPGYNGSISISSTIVGLPQSNAATVLQRISDTQYQLSGTVPDGSFTGANTLRVTTSAALAEMAYAALYDNITITNNFVDPTGSFSCVQNLGTPVANMVMSGNESLVTGTPISGIGYSANGAHCPPLY